MSDRMLTDAERQRFAKWLLEDADSSEALIGQLAKMPMPIEALITRLRVEAAAAKVVAAKLLITESCSIRDGSH